MLGKKCKKNYCDVWAAQYNTGLPIKLTQECKLFSFLFRFFQIPTVTHQHVAVQCDDACNNYCDSPVYRSAVRGCLQNVL